MQYEDERAIMRHLLPGESLLWFGRPATGLIFRKSDLFLVPFSIAWGGFAFFWEYMAYRSGAPLFFLLFGGIFVVMGLHIIFGRFIYDALRRGKTIFAFTGGRLLMLTGGTLSAWNLRDLPPASLRLLPDRSGTISFGAVAVTGLSRLSAVRGVPPVLERIGNASEVFNMIQSARTSPRAPGDNAEVRTTHRGSF